MAIAFAAVTPLAVAQQGVGLAGPPATPRASAMRHTDSLRPSVPNLSWHACGKNHPDMRCTRVRVPLDYDRPGGATTSLALAKLPATDRRHRIGTLFVNPGGPGGSGVGFVLDGFGSYLESKLHGRYDIVGFDPRGIARSDPLRCFSSISALNRHFAGVPYFPYRAGQYQPYYHAYASLGPRCQHRHQRVVRHMSTADVVRDLDLLRRAVGDSKLNFLGFSYGTYIGNTYANLFPRKVGTVVIDGVLNPKLWSHGSQIRSDRVATKREFVDFLRQCDLARRECAFWRPGGSATRWERLTAAIRADPVRINKHPYTYDLLVGDALGAMYSPEVWDDYATFLDQVADAALGGSLRAAHKAAHSRASVLALLRPKEADYSNGLEAYYGNQCADTQYPRPLWKWRAIDDFAAMGSRFGPYWWWGNAGCARWPVAADRFTGPWSAHPANPVLIVGNYFDGVTDYAGAQASARYLQGSRLLSYAGWGHTAYGRSACVTRIVDAFLLHGSLPARGTVCPANPNPFLPAAKALSPAPLVGLPGIGLSRG
jgi:pimeloyl-ACP methyl ester carboxylesterase